MKALSIRRWTAVALAAVLLIFTASANSFALDIKRMKLGNGATLLVSEQHQLPMITVAMAFDAGSRRDPKGKEGLGALTARSLSEGTKKLTAAELNEKIDFMGSSLGTSAGQDYASASCTTLTRYAGQTLRLLAEVIAQPGLRDADIARKRAEMVADLKAANERPGYVADLNFTRLLFGGSPYGHLPSGTVESVQKLTAADVRSFHKRFYRSGNAIIAVAGDVDAAKIKALFEEELAGMAGSAPVQKTPAAPAVAEGFHLTKIDRDVTQANIIMGFGGVARSNPDYYRLQVMNYILGGGGFASRLVQSVRSKAGLAYSVGSGFEPGLFPGSFRVILQTKNSSANEAIRLVLRQLELIRSKPVSDAELGSAKKFLIGSFPLKIDRQSAIAGFILQVELYGLGLDYADKYPGYISSVTKDDVQRVAKQYLHPGAILAVAVADQAKAEIAPPAGVAH